MRCETCNILCPHHECYQYPMEGGAILMSVSTWLKARKVVERYIGITGAHTVERGAQCKLCHVRWMLFEMQGWGPEKFDKLMRWLGFVQGAFWCEKVYTIDEMRTHIVIEGGE